MTRIVAAIITGTVERRQSTPGKVIDDAMGAFSGVMGEWLRLLEVSFLDDGLKDIYTEVLLRRKTILGL